MSVRHPITGALSRDRFLLVPCDAPGTEDLTIIWDRQQQQVIDVISSAEAAAYAPAEEASL